MELNLKGHTVLITGAATGIGLATARGFADEGCCVVLWDRAPEVESVAEQIAKDFQVPHTHTQNSGIHVSEEVNISLPIRKADCIHTVG